MILRRSFLAPLAIVFAGLVACGDGDSQHRAPNLVFIVADDLGWNDVSFHGSEIATPHIDRLAADGVELRRFYAAPVCSPTRMGVLTGRYPMRWGMMDSAVRPWETRGLPPGETTLPEMLAAVGYETRTFVGKWHAGHASRDYHPLEQGFTGFYGFYNGQIDYFTHELAGEPDWHRDFEPVDVGGLYSTDLVTEEAVRVIRSAAAAQAPFFLSVNYNAPHIPLSAPEGCARRVDSIENESRRLFASAVVCMDDGIGAVLDALDEAGVRQDTLLIFFSDNGGHEIFGASNDPLRGEKLQVYEGGIRVPAVIRWPAGGLSDGTALDVPIAYVDWLPTLARIVGAGDRLPAVLDGVDVWDVLGGAATSIDRDIFSFVGPNLLTGPDGPDSTSVIRWPWKLVRVGSNLLEHPEEQGDVELFDIERDPHETSNVAADHPEVAEALLERTRELRALQPDGQELSPLRPPPGWTAPPLWRIPDAAGSGDRSVAKGARETSVLRRLGDGC